MNQPSILHRLLHPFHHTSTAPPTPLPQPPHHHISEDQTELNRFHTLHQTHLATNVTNTQNGDPPVIRSTLNSFLNSSPEGDTALHTLLLLRPSHRVVREMIRLYPEVRLLLASLRYCFGDMLNFQNNLQREFVNARNRGGATALHVALRCGCTRYVVDVLLEEGSLEYARYRNLNEEDREEGEEEAVAAGGEERIKESLASVPMNAGTYPLHLACLYPFRSVVTPQQQQHGQGAQAHHDDDDDENSENEDDDDDDEEENNNHNEPPQPHPHPQQPPQQPPQHEDHQRPIIERLLSEDPKIITKMAGWGNTPLSLFWQPEYAFSPLYSLNHQKQQQQHNHNQSSTSSSSTTTDKEEEKEDVIATLDEMDWSAPNFLDTSGVKESVGHVLTEKWEVSLLLVHTAQQQIRKKRRLRFQKLRLNNNDEIIQQEMEEEEEEEEEEDSIAQLTEGGMLLQTLCNTPFVPPALVQLALMFGSVEELTCEEAKSGYLPLHFAVSTCMIFPVGGAVEEQEKGVVEEEKTRRVERKWVRRGKRDKEDDAAPSTTTTNTTKEITLEEAEEEEKPKIYRTAVEVLTTTYPTAASIREKIERRLPLHLASLKMKRWDGCVECVVSAYPEALVMRDPVTGLFPFMLAAVGDEDESTSSFEVEEGDEYLEGSGWRRRGKDIVCRGMKEGCDDDKEEKEEDGQLTVVFELLRCSPEILSFPELELLTFGEDEEKKKEASLQKRRRSSIGDLSVRNTGKRVWSFFSNLLGADRFSSSSSGSADGDEDDGCYDVNLSRPHKRRRMF